MKINPGLVKKIKQALAKDPNSDEDALLASIMCANPNQLRLTKESIKSGIRQYFNSQQYSHLKLFSNGKEPLNPRIPQEVTTGQRTQSNTQSLDGYESKIKKKVKKNQFLIQFCDKGTYKFQNLGGITELFSTLTVELFNQFNYRQLYEKVTLAPQNRGYLLVGGIGSGKTAIAHCILSHLKNNLIPESELAIYSVNACQILLGDTEQKLNTLFQTIQQHLPAVLFVDNIEELAAKDNARKPGSPLLISLCSFIQAINEKQVYFIAATSNPEKLDAVSRHGLFYKQIRITNPNEAQRGQILTKILIRYQHNVDSQITLLAKMTSGFVAADLVSLAKQATTKCVQRLIAQNPQSCVLQLQDFQLAFSEVQPILKRQGFAKIPTTKLSDVGALEQIKEALKQEIILPIRQQEKFRNMNFDISGSGILLYGPPGCGKTMIAKAIANEANANFITVKGPELLTKYVGESEQAVRKVFQRAKLSAPCVIFFDEFDALAPKRQDQGNQVTERVVNTLLNELNGVQERKMVFVIAATNRPDIIDEAVLRSGRIEKHLYVPLPNQQERLQILKAITSKVSCQHPLELSSVAEKATGFSGADLYFIVKKAITSAVSQDRDRIKSEDLIKAFKSYKNDKYSKKNGLQMTQAKEETQDDDLLPVLDSNDHKIPKPIEEHLQTTSKSPTNKQNLFNQFVNFIVNKNRGQDRVQNQ